jgi:hypothetical protein
MKSLNRILGVIMSLILASSGFAQLKDQVSYELSVGFSVVADLNIVDISQNQENIFDNSRLENKKLMSFTTTVKNVVVSGSNFSGVSYSEPFFNYQATTSIRGKFNKDRSKIEYVTVNYTFTQFSGDHKLSYTSEQKQISFTMTNLEVGFNKQSYGIPPRSGGLVDGVSYNTGYYNKRTHNRSEEYSESIVNLHQLADRPNTGSVTFLKNTPYVPKEPLTVRVMVNRENKNTIELKQSLGLASMAIAQLSKMEGITIKEGVNRDKLAKEIELQESGLVDSEQGMDTDKAKDALDEKADLEIWIDVEADDSDKPGGIALGRFIFKGKKGEFANYASWQVPDFPMEQIGFWIDFHVGRARE